MSLTVINNRGYINTRGGAILKASQRNPDGTTLSSPDSVHDWGEIKNSSFKDKTVLKPIYNEANEKVATEQSPRDTGFMCTLLQRDQKTIDSLRNASRDNYFICMHELGRNVNGLVQRLFCFGQIEPDAEFKLPGGEIPLNFEGIIIDSAVTLTPGELSSWAGNTTALTSNVTIPAGDWAVIVETNT